MFCECGFLIVAGVQTKNCPNCHRLIVFEAVTPEIHLNDEIHLSKSSAVEKGVPTKDPITYDECPECGNQRAYYKMIQNRSSDEPETIFLQCANEECQHRWKKQ